MSDRSPFDRRLRDWMAADAPDAAPDHLREAVRTAVDVSGQHSVVRFRRSRLGSMVTPLVSAALGGLTVLVVVAIAVSGLGGQNHIGGSPAIGSPTTAPTPSGSPPTPVPSPAPSLQGSPMPAGSFSTTHFSPAVQLDLPAGWVLVEDEFATLHLSPIEAGWGRQGDGLVNFDGISLYRHPVAGPPDGGALPVSGVGTTARELADWLSTRPQLVSTKPKQVTIGGLPGYELDFHLSSNAGFLCGVACVNLLNSGDDVLNFQYGLEGPWHVRATLVDLPGGPTVMVAVDGPSGRAFDRLLAEAQPIIESLRFPTS